MAVKEEPQGNQYQELLQCKCPLFFTCLYLHMYSGIISKIMLRYSEVKTIDLPILLLRLGFGLSMMVFHGWGKLMGGVEKWEKLGMSMQMIGIDFYPVFWGFMAAFAEFFCSAFLILGIFFTPAALVLCINMLIAALYHLFLPEGSSGAGIKGASHAIEYLLIYIVFVISGPGKHRVNFG